MDKLYLRGIGVVAMMVLLAAIAGAQATRTWVSGVGDDANPCSRTAPCRTFAGSIAKTANGGEINCLDPGSFGAVTIIKSITISCSNTMGGIHASAVSGIIINASAGDVRLKGLHINGLGTSTDPPGTRGISIVNAAKVSIEDVVIDGFTDPSSGFGVGITAGGVQVSIVHTSIRHNVIGVSVAPSAGVADVTINDSSIAFNTIGVSSDANATARLARSSLTYNGTAVGVKNGGQVISYQNNTLEHNTSPGGPLTPAVTH